MIQDDLCLQLGRYVDNNDQHLEGCERCTIFLACSLGGTWITTINTMGGFGRCKMMVAFGRVVDG